VVTVAKDEVTPRRLNKDADKRLAALNRSVVNGAKKAQAKGNQKRGKDQGSVRRALIIVVAGLGLFAWGWSHGSRTPDGRWLAAVAILGLVVLLFATGAVKYRRREAADAARTKRIEDRLQQNTSTDHYLDGAS